MTATIKPATPLPWKLHGADGDIGSVDLNGAGDYSGSGYSPADAAYIVHACNSYPKLVEALDALQVFICSGRAVEYAPKAWGAYPPDCIIEARALLREIGEQA